MTRRRSLTAEQVREIRALNAQGIGYRKLSAMFGIPQSTIRDHIKYWVGYSL